MLTREKSQLWRNSSNGNFIFKVYGIIPIGFNFNGELKIRDKFRPGINSDQREILTRDKSQLGRNSSNGNFIFKVYGIIPMGFNFNGKKLRPGINSDQG